MNERSDRTDLDDSSLTNLSNSKEIRILSEKRRTYENDANVTWDFFVSRESSMKMEDSKARKHDDQE